MNKISLKLGTLFFFIILILESFLFFFLHDNIVESRIEEELTALQARGNSHRDVVEKSYKSETLHHIALMEAQAETEVIITDEKREIIISSNDIDQEEKNFLAKKVGNLPREGRILEDRWRSEKYISTISPYYIDTNKTGYVYMFKSTDQVQDLISRLNSHFLIAGILTISFLVFTILFLTKALTTPLIKMKKATEKLSKGDFSVNLPKLGDDELGDLSDSIEILANDLNHLKNERKEFLASISHELRTPLTYIKGYADVARRDTLNKSDREKYLNIIYEESEKLSDMIKDLFDLARIDQNNFTINREFINFPLYLQVIYEKMLPAFREKNIQLVVNCEDDLKVFIDPLRFEQILLNLLDNAKKYSQPNTKTSINAKREKGKVKIEVKDEGYGIPEEDIPFIFERFYRVEKSRSSRFGGSGLGLAIVKELVDTHEGGEIRVESKANQGTTFIITLEELRK
ncbi:HAMP domain-containing histidine kinase [Peribacillus cavernae]|uniref:histidine kinase n=1 Tax=Peribacillus cavernae TaxID=1674310 RepID=A0A433HUQ0_9BACI|nr:HAMP domain-containing sensor histidine kinase [Peribacillus cavernae]MDQ0219992.1 signal transduction histidine kinase [Peribacillus cavernae]RUQ32057.1 HAMP domain-containing histidine kinase [Peribacillus cavernae]